MISKDATGKVYMTTVKGSTRKAVEVASKQRDMTTEATYVHQVTLPRTRAQKMK